MNILCQFLPKGFLLLDTFGVLGGCVRSIQSVVQHCRLPGAPTDCGQSTLIVGQVLLNFTINSSPPNGSPLTSKMIWR